MTIPLPATRLLFFCRWAWSTVLTPMPDKKSTTLACPTYETSWSVRFVSKSPGQSRSQYNHQNHEVMAATRAEVRGLISDFCCGSVRDFTKCRTPRICAIESCPETCPPSNRCFTRTSPCCYHTAAIDNITLRYAASLGSPATLL